ncbi:MAG: adenosine deaminase [Verrucomicrobiota bacterium]
MTDTSLREFLLLLPKTETHLHLEGAVPYWLYQKYVPDLPRGANPVEDPEFRYAEFDEFNERLLSCALPFFVSLERYREAAHVVFRECQAQGVRYLEVSFHLGIVMGISNLHPEEVIQAILEEAPSGLEVRVYAGLAHNDYNSPLKGWIDESPEWKSLFGLDLHGPETLPFEDWTAEVWRVNREQGKSNRAHAGEFRGADFVETVVRDLQVKRVAHGVRAIENPATVALVKEEGVTFDVCPISNWKLRVGSIERMSDHPVRKLFDEGVRVTISTDDPTFFGNCLIDDYEMLYKHCGFSRSELVQIARNGFEVADLSFSQKASFELELDRIEDGLEG